MIRFLDGPAEGQTMELSRAPLYLRAVEWNGKWDALDQLEDQPGEAETIHVYKRVGKSSWTHILYATGRGRKGVFSTIAEYRHIQPVPDDAEVRATDRWRAWCRERKAWEETR